MSLVLGRIGFLSLLAATVAAVPTKAAASRRLTEVLRCNRRMLRKGTARGKSPPST